MLYRCLLLACLLATPYATFVTDATASNQCQQKPNGVTLPLPGGGCGPLHGLYVDAVSFGLPGTPPVVEGVPTRYSSQPTRLQIGSTPSPEPAGPPVTRIPRRQLSALDSTTHKAPGPRHSMQRSTQVIAGRRTEILSAASTAVARHLLAPASAPQQYKLRYHGGALMDSGANVYMLYLGFKPSDATTLVLNHLVANLGSSRWWATLKGYATGGSTFSTELNLKGVAYINNLQPIHIKSNDTEHNLIGQLVQHAIDNKLLPNDLEKGIYVVVNGPDGGGIVPYEGWCSQDCGWHDSMHNGLKFVFIRGGCEGKPGCDSSAAVLKGTQAATGSVDLDGKASVLAHELAETVTDPMNALGWWDDKTSFENGDICNFQFGSPSQYQFDGGHSITYNQVIGGYPFLLQQMYDVTQRSGSSEQVGCVYGAQT